MCRITGIWDQRNHRNYNLSLVGDQMRDALIHGGPDGFHSYFLENKSIYFGHRRLSIIDLSSNGTQPMTYKHLTICFNGEIYNYKEIKSELISLGHLFQTQSDTEVILHAYEQWGSESVHRFRGMFAIVLWDNDREEIIIIRDRMGVKPLFLYHKEGLFLFASELKAFHKHPDFDKSINHDVLYPYLQKGFIPVPHSIFQYVQKIEPGTVLTINKKGFISKKKYWDPRTIIQEPALDFSNTEDCIKKLDEILQEAFQLRMVSDVEVGIFLSGGIDSSLVTAIIQSQNSLPIHTFTIGFDDPIYNEANHAASISSYLGTKHEELICNSKDFEELITRIPEILDEPMGDSSIIPTFLLSSFASKKVKVSLSADGGDELFGGYTKYQATTDFYPKLKHIPSFVKGLAAKMGHQISTDWLDKNAKYIPLLKNYRNYSHKLPKLLRALEAKNEHDFFERSSIYIDSKLLHPLLSKAKIQPSQVPTDFDMQRKLSYWGMIDMEHYLEADILNKVDRATMHNALEGREPFLDHKITEFALRLPDRFKKNEGNSKWILKQILNKYVPKELTDRPKQGFSIPLETWLRTHLVEDLRQMSVDEGFSQAFQLNSKVLQIQIHSFLQKKNKISPSYFWFLWVLFSWYKKWLS